MSNNFVESILYFQPHDGKEEEVKNLVKKATQTIQSEEGCLFYGGFTGETGLVRVRGGFSGAESFVLHVQKEQQTMMSMMALGNITSMQVHGPKEAEPVLRPLVEAQGGQYFTLEPCGFSRLPNKAMKTALDIVPFFTVKDGKIEEFKAICPKFVAVTEAEKGCLYYGFSVRNNVVCCIEAYEDAEAVAVHVEEVGEHLRDAMAISSLDLEIHGTEEEIEKIREKTKDLRPRFFLFFTGYGKA